MLAAHPQVLCGSHSDIPKRRGSIYVPVGAGSDRGHAKRFSHIEVPPVRMTSYRKRVDGALPYDEDVLHFLPETPIYFHQTGDDLGAMLRELSSVASIPVSRDEENPQISEADITKSALWRKIDVMGAGRLCSDNPTLYGEVIAVMEGISLITGGRFVGGSDIWYRLQS